MVGDAPLAGAWSGSAARRQCCYGDDGFCFGLCALTPSCCRSAASCTCQPAQWPCSPELKGLAGFGAAAVAAEAVAVGAAVALQRRLLRKSKSCWEVVVCCWLQHHAVGAEGLR